MNLPATDSLPSHVWSVSALCHAISDHLSSRFGLLTVQGEISGLTRAASGHFYLSLKDEQGQLRCAMFRRQSDKLSFTPRNGLLVQVQARCGLYEPRGELQLVIETMRLAGEGQLHEAFLRLKATLQAQGLFDADRKRGVPLRPRCIGVVTSLAAAALQDVLTALKRRVPHIPVVLAPSPVQGADAPASLVAALEALQSVPQVDVILLVRGGGSIEDLWAFNDEALAHAIVACHVPVVVGVGHETDVTIADFCADLRAPTPTAAAELCALERATDLDQLQSLQGSLVQAATGRLALAAQRLDRAEQQLGRPSAWLHRQTQRGLGLTHRLIRAATQAAHRQSLALQPLAPRLQRAALEMPLSLARRLDKAQWRLQSLDPKAVLKRGYAWLENNQGQALASVEDLKPGERVVARLVDGQASLEVKQVL